MQEKEYDFDIKKKKKGKEMKEKKTKLIVFFRSFRSQSSSISRLHTLSVTKMQFTAVEMRQFTDQSWISLKLHRHR